jgi:hypothetical protein
MFEFMTIPSVKVFRNVAPTSKDSYDDEDVAFDALVKNRLHQQPTTALLRPAHARQTRSRSRLLRRSTSKWRKPEEFLIRVRESAIAP